MRLYENYNPIFGFGVNEYIASVEYIRDRIENDMLLLGEIEGIHSSLQTQFDIFHPNISFTVAGFVFDPITKFFTAESQININNNRQVVEYTPLWGSTNIGPDSVLMSERVEDGISYLKDMFLEKDIAHHNVYWLYKKDSIDSILNEGYEWQQGDIPNFTTMNNLYWRKINEFFPKLYVSGADINNSATVVTKYVSELALNNKSILQVKANSKTVKGDTFYADSNALFVFNSVSIIGGALYASSGFLTEERSPLEKTYASKNILLKTLSNAQSLNIKNKEYSDRGADEVVTVDNVTEVGDGLLPVDSSSLPLTFSVEQSLGREAVSFRQVYNLLYEAATSYYIEQLKLFTDGYSGGGALGELIKEIEELIDEMRSAYAILTECASAPLNNINEEGCVWQCPAEDIHNKGHLMVTKQRLLMHIACDMSCQ